jgi:hypothetical protein
MMPHLGVLAQVHPDAALEVFERDCLIYLGTCVAPKGRGKPGKRCFGYEINGPTLNGRGELSCGEIRLLPLPPNETARIRIIPARGFDAGAGSGKEVEAELRGGTVGVILDARGRPLEVPFGAREMMAEWVRALSLYPNAD